MKNWLYIILLTPAFGLAQLPKKTLEAKRMEAEVAIDGFLTDAPWHEANLPVADSFVMLDPRNGISVSSSFRRGNAYLVF